MKLILSLALFQVVLTVGVNGQAVEKQYHIEAYQKDGDSLTLILKVKPVEVAGDKQGRQVDEDGEDEDTPSTTPYIPQIIPGLTKIFNGIVTGNLNEIFHGSTSFAPRETSHAIDTVYNTVVGIPPPKTTIKTTPAPLATNATVSPVAASAAAATSAPDDEDDPDTEDSDLNFSDKKSTNIYKDAKIDSKRRSPKLF